MLAFDSQNSLRGKKNYRGIFLGVLLLVLAPSVLLRHPKIENCDVLIRETWRRRSSGGGKGDGDGGEGRVRVFFGPWCSLPGDGIVPELFSWKARRVLIGRAK